MANKFFNNLLAAGGSATVTADTLTAAFGADIDFWLEPRLGGVKKAGGADAAVGDKIDTIIDRSVSGGNVTQTNDALRPLLVDSVYGGVRAAQFAAGAYLRSTTWNGFNGGAGQCWLVVYKPSSLSAGPIVTSEPFHECLRIYHYSGILRIGSFGNGWATTDNVETLGGQIILAVHDGSQTGNANRLKCYLNNTQRVLSSFSNPVGTTYDSPAAGVGIGGASDDGEFLRGDVFCVMHIKRAPTASERTLLWQYARQNLFAVPAAQSDWVGEGDSRWKGYTVALDPNFNKAINYKLATLLGGANVYDYNQAIVGALDNAKRWNTYNHGQEGDTLITAITSQQPALMLQRDEQKAKQILSLFAFTNDNAAGSTAADVYNALTAYAAICRAKGFKFLTITDPGAGGETAPQIANRLAYNALVRTNWATFADAFYDMAADANFDDPNDGINFDVSLVHYTEAGNTAAAQGFYNAALSAGIL